MATPSVLTFDAEGRAVDFEVWVDDLQLFLRCDRADGLSLFDLTSGASPAPPATADSTVRSQWATRDAAARLAVRRHLPTTERAHFSLYRSAQTLYDAVVARYSSPATAALSRLFLPYLFPDLTAFPTVTDLITHLRTSDTRYRAALPAEFCAKNPPPMYLTLYYIVTRLPDSLRSIRDHFLSVCPTSLTVDLLEERLLAAEQSIVAVGASRGDPRTPVFQGRSALRLPLAGDAAPARARGAEVPVGLAGAVEVVVVEAVEGAGVVVGVVAGVEASVAAVEAAEAEVAEAEVAEAAVALVAALRRGVVPVVVRTRSSNAVARPLPPSSFVTGTLVVSGCGGLHSTQRCFGRLTDSRRHQFPGATEIPRWGDLSRAGVAIFDLDYDAILAAMYALSTSDEGDCYLCLPPDPGGGAAALSACEAAALGASASAAPSAGESALSGTASAQVFHTFTLDSGASRSFFRDRTTITPLSRPVAVSLADPSGGPVLASFSTVLPCPAAPSGTLSGLYLPSFSTNLVSGADLQDQGVDQFTPASQRVTHCTCARTSRHFATFTRRPGSSLYTLSTESPPIPPSGQVAASSQVLATMSGPGPESTPYSCRLLSHQTLLWHHCLGHPSLPRLRGMASRVLVSGLPRSLPPLPPGPAPTCVPCVEGRQRAAPHSSEFPPTEAPLQTLHMDVWGPARVRGQGHERYFLLVVDDYSRFTTVFPLRSKGEVTKVLIDWIRAARLRLRQSFGSDFPVLRLHSDRGGEFSSALLGAFCRAQGIRQTFTLPASPQQNGIAERRIGMVMDVARTSMIHAAAPHFLWPFAVQFSYFCPPFTASLATAATDVTAAAVTTSLRSRGRSGRRGGQGAGGGGEGGVASGGGGSTEVGGATRSVASDSPAAARGGDARVCQAPAGPPSAALADPTSGPVTARYTTTLPCPAVPSSFLTGFHVPSFSRNLVGVRSLVSSHVGVWSEPSGKTAVCVDGDTYAPLATFTVEPGSGLYTLHTGLRGQQQQPQPQQQHLLPPTTVTAPRQVPLSGSPVSPGCRVSPGGCVWSVSRVWSICCILLLPVACPPHHSEAPPLEAPINSSPAHYVWSTSCLRPPASLAVASAFACTTLQSLRRGSATRHPSPLLPSSGHRALRDSPLGRLRPGSLPWSYAREFLSSSIVSRFRVWGCLTLVRDTSAEGIRQTFTLPASPQKNGIAERRIGMVMDVARASMIHAAAPHFLWPFAVQYVKVSEQESVN
ncbi:unnamed protein product [Closterium sp. NIES-54]